MPIHIFFVLLIACIIAPASVRADDEEDNGSGLRYRVHFEGIEDGSLRGRLEEVSNLFAQRDQRPLSRSALERRANADEKRLRAALESEGYYGATIYTEIDYATSPIDVTIAIDPGPAYRIAAFEIVYETDAVLADARLDARVRRQTLAAGTRARAEDVLAAEADMLSVLHRSGFALAEISGRSYVLDLERHAMTVTVSVDPGRRWRFGDVTVTGTTDVQPGFVVRKAPWEKGDRFDLSALESYRRALMETGLFASIAIEAGSIAEADGDLLPVHVRVAERAHRTIGLGARYATNEGPGGRIYWQHRNFQGRARTLDLSVTGALIRQSFDAAYRQPEFLRRDQALFSTLTLARERSDAFDEDAMRTALGLERQIIPPLKVSAAGEFEWARVRDGARTRTSQLVTLPLIATYDTSNDLLDPRRGMRVKLRVAPSAGFQTGPVSFLTVESTASGYIPMMRKPRTVLALRARVGSILGEGTDGIPANRRFYAGGGGSLRAYGYRDAGPLDAGNDPVGGRAVTELGAEVRVRVTETIGLVPFVEAGNVYDGPAPRFRGFLWGAGLGVRYYSPVGPIRLDVAVPIDRRRGVDDAVQVYVSIGQAF